MFTVACRNKATLEQQQKGQAIVNSHLINVNKIITQKESQEIDNYIASHHWEMKKTGTGLRYSIYNLKSSGPNPENGSVVNIRSTISLLNGTVCYSGQSNKVKSYQLGKGELTNGMEEALKMMRPGEKAKLVMPSHLAFGLTGDGNEIPTKSPLVCDLELISIRN